MKGKSRPFCIPKDQLFHWKELRMLSRNQFGENPPKLRLFWARNAIFHGLRALGVKPGERILVPSYLCAAAIEPIEAFGATVAFYAIQRDCTPDWQDLESKIDQRTRGVLAAHYFGFPLDVRRLRNVCGRSNLFFIEDCAHVLKGAQAEPPLGTFGDVSVFSWRKFLPLFDGAELLLNRSAENYEIDWATESPLFTLRVAKNLAEQLLSSFRNRRFHGTLSTDGVPEEDDQAVSCSTGIETPLAVDPNSASFLSLMVDFPMSRCSRFLLSHFDVGTIAARRRYNYGYLLEKLSRIKQIRPLFATFPAGVVPWIFPLFIEGVPNAHKRLRAMGIPATTWGGVRHPRIAAREFPDADFLYENLIFLPIHQDLETEDLNLIVEAVERVKT